MLDENNSIAGEDGEILLNGEPFKKIISGKGEREIVCVFTDDGNNGTQSIEIDYSISPYVSPTEDGYFRIKKVDILTGDDAAGIAAEQADYPVAQDCEGLKLSLVSDEPQVLFWIDGEDVTSSVETSYLISGTVHLYGQVGPGVDPDCVIVYDNNTGNGFPLTSYPVDDEGFLIDIDPAEFGGPDGSMLLLYLFDPVNNYASDGLYVFPDAEAADQICSQLSEMSSYEVTWSTAEDSMDGSVTETESESADSSAAPEAETEQETENPSAAEGTEDGSDSKEEYVLCVKDQNGDQVEGTVVQVCDDETCSMYTSDEEGYIRFNIESEKFELHILKVPEGYTFDKEAELPIPQRGSITSLEVIRE